MASKSTGKEQLPMKNTDNTSNKRTNTKCKTPVKNIVSGIDRKKSRSSMKKIKKFLRSHGKKKSILPRSPSLSQVKLSLGFEQRMKSCDSKDKLSVSTRPARLAALSSNDVKQLKPVTRSSGSLVNQQPAKRMCQSLAVDFLPSDALLSPATSNKDGASKCKTAQYSPMKVANDGVIKSTGNDFTDADQLFAYMIEPVSPPKFFKDIWEKKPLLVRRHNSQHNDGWFSTKELDRILHQERVNFTDNVDVVTYMNGKRETHNPVGRAYAPVVWDFYQNGCSVRLLNPYTYTHSVWKYLSLIQQYFGCVAGANVYLTPPGSQGFAPHWDDIEAFVLQLEGKKHWRVYEPRSEDEVLPRFSSPNFSDADLPSPPVLEAVLEPGDLLYFPRGYIHQASTMEGSHSLHITVSVAQKNSWGDFLEKLLSRALDIAMEEDVEFRRSLPSDWLNYMGVAFSDEENVQRSRFRKTVHSLMTKLTSFAPIDAACDQMAKQFLQNSLPPVLTDDEKQCSVHGHGEHWNPQDLRVRGAVEIDPDTEIRLIRKGMLRLVTEDDKVFVYHSLENSRILHGTELQCIEVEPPMAEGVEFLLKRYPDYVAVDGLPLDTVEERITLATSLYDRGLVMTRVPMESLSDDDDSCDTMSQSTVDSAGET